MAMYLGSNKVEIGQSSGGGSSDFEQIEVEVMHSNSEWYVSGINVSYNGLLALANNDKYPYIEFTAEEAEGLTNSGIVTFGGKKYVMRYVDAYEGYYYTTFSKLAEVTSGGGLVEFSFGAENANDNMVAE